MAKSDEGVLSSLLIKTTDKSLLSEPVVGYDWSESTATLDKVLSSYKNCGFQATNFGLAIQQLNEMIKTRNLPIPTDHQFKNDGSLPIKNNCTIFLGYTSNIVSSGLRESICYLVKNKMVDCIVTTAGGIEEDFIKCLAPTYLGDFKLDGTKLRKNGLNRTGNLLVPNDNYCRFEMWIMPLLEEMLVEQNEKKTLWTPSKLINRLGERINNEESIYYWAAKHGIPVFCPALTDGSIGDMMFIHTYRSPGFVLDIIEDCKRINHLAMNSVNTGMLVVGGGVVKHHICNANAMRDGAKFSVFINTACEFDGSDAGANPDEAKSWGKIKLDAKPVKIFAEATLILPLLISQTFAKQ